MSYQVGSGYSYRQKFSQLDFDRFASLSGDDNPIHIDSVYAANSKFGKTVAHGMLLYSGICRCLSEQFPANLQYSVQLKFPNPTYANQSLSITQEIIQIDPNQEWLEVASQVLHPDGESGCDSQIKLSHTPHQNIKLEELDGVVSPAPEDAGTFKGLQIGQSAKHTRKYTQSDINEYVDICGDFNQLHTNYKFVKTNGFKNLVVPMPLIGGLFSYLLGTKLPGRGTNWLKLSLNLLQPVCLDEKIKAKVRITRIRAEKSLINLELTALGPHSRMICRGEALVLAKDLVPAE